MKSRTRTNLHICNGAQFLAELINNVYGTGSVGIVYEDKHKQTGGEISKLLLKNGNKVKSMPLSEYRQHSFAEHERFILGIGGINIAKTLPQYMDEKLFAYYCLEIIPDFFAHGLLWRKEYTFAEFAYFDTLKCDIRDTKILRGAYVSLLSLLVSLADEHCCKFILPYRDSESEVLIKEIKSILLRPVDKDYYLSSILKIIKNAVEYLEAKKINPLIYRIRQKNFEDWSYEKEFFIDYLLFFLALIFTKWDINDMLIPSLTAKESNLMLTKILLKQEARIRQIMLSKEEMNHISMVFRALGNSFEDIDIMESFAAIIENASDEEGLFAEINSMGITERLIEYEEYQRY